MTSMAFQLPRTTAAARVTLSQGRPRPGTIYLAARVPQHDGPETPLEMLNRPDAFFPFQPTDGGAMLLIGKTQVIALAVDHVPAAVTDPDRLSAAKLLRLEVVLTNGATITGHATVELPEQHSRPLDFLNAGSASFFALSTDEGTFYVNRAHVLFAHPED